jgi:NADH-quinone oxidoreductase subunit L
MNEIWLIPLLPGVGALLNGVAGVRYFSRRLAGLLACTTMAVSLGLSVFVFVELLGRPPNARVIETTPFPWIPPIALETVHGLGKFDVPWLLRVDPLAGMMILIVTGVGFLIHVYSTAYMQDEPRGGYARYFCYLNLFCFFMLMLVLGANFLVMFVGWEGVGLCSYLLIGYWYEKKSASDAGMKAFIVNRLGDWGFILGVFLVYFTFSTLDFRAVAEAAAGLPRETKEVGFGVLSAICLLLFVGAAGKSAQIPLYVWLPDAMEGPTPVSALIHAATMVTAGVYMVGRNAVLFERAPQVMTIVAIVGVLTALMAASIGLVQTDIKRVLAYSTVSQLGYMFLAMGVGAFGAGIFHLYTHAFFKALLFLGSGAVIHAMAGEQDMRKMGGLARFMPVTFVTMVMGTLAIAGIPPFAGFFSKDEILFRAFLENRVLWGLAAVTALMTAFYMFRLMALTFWGGYRGPAWAHHGPADSGASLQAGPPGAWHGPHEAPRAMTVPLMALAVGAFVAGFVGIPSALGGNNAIERFLEPSFTAHAPARGTSLQARPDGAADNAQETAPPARSAEARHQAGHETAPHMSRAGEIGLMLLSVALAAIGISLVWRNYVRKPEISERWAARWAGAHRLLTNKYYVDELYDATIVRGTLGGGRGLWTFDARVVDGAVNGSGWVTRVSSWFSHLFDKYIVDGLVNLIGWGTGESSFAFRRVQTGLIQNYALLMLFGVFAFLSLYLLARL